MKQILIQLLILSPALIEANIIDLLYWRAGRSDKPYSTHLRVIMTVGVAAIIQFWIKDNWATLAIFGTIAWYVGTFNYNVNLWLKQPMSYKQNWWLFGNPFVKVLLVLIYLSIYLTFNSTINESASIPFNIPRFR